MQQPEINPWGELTPGNALRAGGGARRCQPARGAQAMAGRADAEGLRRARAGDALGPPLPDLTSLPPKLPGHVGPHGGFPTLGPLGFTWRGLS